MVRFITYICIKIKLMAKKKTNTKEVAHLSVKISPELYGRIKLKAEKDNRSPHYIMVKCLEKGFK